MSWSFLTSLFRKTRDKPEPPRPDLLSDCRLMLSFARKNGFVLSPSLVHEIGWLDSVLCGRQIAPVSGIATSLIQPIDMQEAAPLYVARDPAASPADPAPAGLSPEEVVLDVHSKLSVLITPTTALSLQTSEPPANRRHIFGGMPPLVQVVIVVAFISAVGFSFSASQISGKGQRSWKARRDAAAAAAAAASAASAVYAAAAASAFAAAVTASAAHQGGRP